MDLWYIPKFVLIRHLFNCNKHTFTTRRLLTRAEVPISSFSEQDARQTTMLPAERTHVPHVGRTHTHVHTHTHSSGPARVVALRQLNLCNSAACLLSTTPRLAPSKLQPPHKALLTTHSKHQDPLNQSQRDPANLRSTQKKESYCLMDYVWWFKVIPSIWASLYDKSPLTLQSFILMAALSD